MFIWNTEDLIYDYSLQVNDTFMGVLIVDQIDFITLLSGEIRKRLTMRCVWDDNPPTDFGYSYWIEGLGGSKGLYTSIWSQCAFDADEYTTLCISRNDTLIYDDPEFIACWYPATQTFNAEDPVISIFPNPASTEINISSKDHLIQNIQVIDLLGNMIPVYNTSPVDINFLSSGYYILRIELENKQVIMKSFVKQ